MEFQQSTQTSQSPKARWKYHRISERLADIGESQKIEQLLRNHENSRRCCEITKIRVAASKPWFHGILRIRGNIVGFWPTRLLKFMQINWNSASLCKLRGVATVASQLHCEVTMKAVGSLFGKDAVSVRCVVGCNPADLWPRVLKVQWSSFVAKQGLVKVFWRCGLHGVRLRAFVVHQATEPRGLH